MEQEADPLVKKMLIENEEEFLKILWKTRDKKIEEIKKDKKKDKKKRIENVMLKSIQGLFKLYIRTLSEEEKQEIQKMRIEVKKENNKLIGLKKKELEKIRDEKLEKLEKKENVKNRKKKIKIIKGSYIFNLKKYKNEIL